MYLLDEEMVDLHSITFNETDKGVGKTLSINSPTFHEKLNRSMGHSLPMFFEEIS